MSSNDLTENQSAVEQLRLITAINVQELLEAFNAHNLSRGRGVIKWILSRPARRFARSVLKYDQLVGEQGLAAGGRYMLDLHTRHVEIHGQQHVPQTGPIVFIANHPGITDSMALFSAITRQDLRILARQREILAALPETTSYLIFLSEDHKARFRAMQQAVKHLKKGGALLTFPAGQIEPDPALYPNDARVSIHSWTASLSMFAQLASQPTFVPIIVSGVVSPQARNSFLAKMREKPADQEWLAAFLQVIWPPYRNVRVQVRFGEPIMATQLHHLPDSETILHYIRSQVAALIPNEPPL